METKENQIRFKINPEKVKGGSYKSMDEIMRDFTTKEIDGSYISVIFNGEIIGTIEGQSIVTASAAWNKCTKENMVEFLSMI